MLFAYRIHRSSCAENTAKPDDDLVIHVYSNNVLSSGKTKALIVVAVGRMVPVTDSGTDVPAVVVPGATAYDTVIAFRSVTQPHPT